MKATTITIGLIVLLAMSGQASVIDAPHNQTHQVGCGACHKYSLWWQYSPAKQNTSPSYEILINSLCLSCHDENGNAPLAKTHSAQVMNSTSYHGGNWSIACTTCHDPHYQDQLNWILSVANPFLVTGTIDSVSVNTELEETTVTYSNASTNESWPSQGLTDQDFDWARKNNSNRGLIFVHDSSLAINTFVIISSNSSQIVIRGILPPQAVNPAEAGAQASCNTFGLIYGQLIRDKVTTPFSGDKNVMFFDPNGGFVTESQEGICQVCHTETRHFRNSGEINVGATGYDHTSKVGSNCMPCHGHSKGFAHGAGTGPGCGTATECHGTQDSHPAHVNPAGILGVTCDRCHVTTDFPTFTKDRAMLCAECHDNGVGAAVGPPIWGTVVAQCTECHSLQPSTGSHSKHLAKAGVECNDCHDVTVQGLAVPGQHLDSNIDVYTETPGDLGYPTDKAKGSAYASCTTAYCHSSGQSADGGSETPTYAAPTWGGNVVCGGCHQTTADTALGAIDTGSHPAHLRSMAVGLVQSCGDCHLGATNTTYPSDNHVNKLIDVNPALTYSAGGVRGNGYGACSSASCHGVGAPEWGGSVACENCHLGSTDVDDFMFKNGTLAAINASQWSYSGHGKLTDVYAVSGNPAANLPGAAGSGSPCTYCHSPAIGHGAADNPFRLANINALDHGNNDNCLICHATAGPGYDPDGDGGVASKTATVKIDKYHYGAHHGENNDGGSLCWDCHDPHGDQSAESGNIFMIHDQVIVEKSDDYGTPAATAVVEFTNNLSGADYARAELPLTGICQACHTVTAHYTSNAVETGHFTGKCIACHAHGTGTIDNFAFNHGGGSSAGGESSSCADLSCHGGSGSHNGHLTNAGLACTACHNLSDMPNFKDGGTDQHTTGICDNCHHDGTVVATGSVNSVSPPDWFSGDQIDCSGCHGSGPNYIAAMPKANSHPAHSGFTCDKCHNATTTTGNSITGPNYHLNNGYNVTAGNSVNFSYSFDADGGGCSAISCHGNTNATWGTGACLGCHSISQGNRAAITSQFSSGSHHVQGGDIDNRHCYQCHWEANADGSLNLTYHSGSSQPGAPIDLVIYGAGTRPTSYSEGLTATPYMADGTRTQIARINPHCLSCHSDQNNDTEPFGDCNTPRQYAWDRNSVAARYSQTGATTLGKYSTSHFPEVAEKKLTKAYSAHGNAVSNQGGWSAVTGLDEAVPNTRAGFQNVLCFDCHNSHGSSAEGVTSSYESFSGVTDGAILKSTAANKGGYTVSYKPTANSDVSDKNPYNSGAGLCFDCHFTPTAINTPWGYQQTFGAVAAIQGYNDGERFGTSQSGSKMRFPYRAGRHNQGGHMMASASLKGLNGVHDGNEANHQINGLCTPCHDPHGVSPAMGANQAYGVPLLKGTWLSSPYKEDSPEMTGTRAGSKSNQGRDDLNERHWNTDRVTFDTNNDIHDRGGKIVEDDQIFAGLCLRCHSKSNLTDGTNKNSAWKTVDRIHETVKGWGNNGEHTFPCSKCHVPHNGGLPRLMKTNCLNFNHRQQLISGGMPSSGSGNGNWGRFPGQSTKNFYETLDSCHENGTAAGGTWPENQLWNTVTPW